MEPLSRIFSAKAFGVLMPAFILVCLELLGWAVLPDGGLSNALGGFLIIGTMVGALGILCSRLHLSAHDGCFSVSVRLFGLTVLSRELRGVSWHAVSTPGGAIGTEENDFCRYRVEVADAEGERSLAMGPWLGWIYGVDCL